MSEDEIDRALADLHEWASQRYGRTVRVARLLGVSPQLLTGWYAKRSTPKLKVWLKLQDFLKKSDKARCVAIGEE